MSRRQLRRQPVHVASAPAPGRILGELDYLPAGAQRAALSRLTAALDLQPAASVAEAAAEAGCEDEVRAAAQAFQDAQTPVDVTPRGKSVEFYEAMLRL